MPRSYDLGGGWREPDPARVSEAARREHGALGWWRRAAPAAVRVLLALSGEWLGA